MVTPITSLKRKECELIPGVRVAAYTDIRLDPDNPTGIILDTTWGETHLDIRGIVKNGETVTRLYLAPEEAPTVLKYEREDGQIDCITGDELSRIVSLQLLKDVDQATPPSDGIVYQYDESTQLFEPFDLKTFVTNTNLAIGRLQAAVTSLTNRLNDIERAIYGWDNDKNTPIARGNINAYGDITNNNSHAHGIFTHDPSTDVVDDLYFS